LSKVESSPLIGFYLFEVWLFCYPVSYPSALSGIETRKAPRKVRFFAGIRVVQAAVQVVEECLAEENKLSERWIEYSRAI